MSYHFRLVVALQVFGDERSALHRAPSARREAALSSARARQAEVSHAGGLGRHQERRALVADDPVELRLVRVNVVGQVAPSERPVLGLVAVGRRRQRAAHQQQARQDAQEERAREGRHATGADRPEVDVERDDRREDGDGNEHGREEDVLAHQRDGDGARRYDLHQQQLKDAEREEDRDAQRDLLAGVRRQVEAENRQQVDGDAGDEQVDSEEERLAAQHQLEGDIGERLGTARIVLVGLLRRRAHQVPLDARVELAEVDGVRDESRLGQAQALLPPVHQIHLRRDEQHTRHQRPPVYVDQ